MKEGSVVIAQAGKEKGQLFIVVRLDDKYAYLSDGKRLKISKPKKKSFKHIKKFDTQTLDDLDLLEKSDKENAKVRKFLSKIRSEHV